LNIEGSIAVVTGANRGLGAAYAEALLERGAAKIYAAVRDVSSVGDWRAPPRRLRRWREARHERRPARHGNGSLREDIKVRALGRSRRRLRGDIPMQLAFGSVSDLAGALQRAGLAHGEYEEALGQGRDEEWAIWYAEHVEREQAAQGTMTSAHVTFASATDLADALMRAEQAHGQYQAQTGREEPDWPNWYAHYFEREQAGAERPS
jgi:NAD(P)-dependent dehydrogenase (short-subunit alcohol dehydrogenase family)